MPVALAHRIVVKVAPLTSSPSDAVAGVMITFTDVTQRIAAAKALVAAKKRAESVHAKSRFLAAASHDLRRPL